jgi:pyrrolidone-carboxylate peptidase
LQGSGGDYLSNEIFYRVGKLRSEIKPTLATGHLHIPMIQEKPIDSYARGNSSTEDMNPKITNLVAQIKTIISKI